MFISYLCILSPFIAFSDIPVKKYSIQNTSIYHVSFFKKEKVTWSQIQTIKYRYKKKKQKFVFTTHDHKTITLRSDILYDGWADFEEYVLDMADIYEIAIIN